MVKFHGKYVAMIAACFIFSFTCCQDKDLYNPETEEEEDNNQPSLLDYSTTQRVKFNLTYDVPEGYVATFDVYSENPFTEDEDGRPTLRTDIEPISGGISISGEYDLTKTLPAYVSDVYVYSSSLFVPTLMKATIQSGIADFKMVDLTGTPTNSLPTTRTVANKMPDYCLLYKGGVGPTSLNTSNDVLLPDGATGSNHEPCINFHKEVPAGVYNKINAAFPEKQKATDTYRSGTSLRLEKACEVWISIIHTEGTQWENTLGYFYHDSESIDELIHEKREGLTNKEIIAVPLAKLHTTDSKLDLRSGDYVQLKYFNEGTQTWENEFPAGLTIGWLLHPKTYDRTNRRLAASGWQWPLCSINTLNTDNHRTDCVVFNARTDEEPFVCIGFEDDYRHGTMADEDFNDVMFHVITNPVDAIETTPTIPPTQDVVTPVKKKGILAFEDNWPNEGDYDLNDVVVKYNSTATLICKANENATYLNKLEDTFSLIHNGGINFNKFGYKIEIDPSYVKSITVNDEEYNLVADNFDNKNGFIVDLCDNIQALESPARYVKGSTPTNYSVVIEFKDGVTETEWDAACAPYNPFITPRENAEVHLPRYSPTGRADFNLFNTGQDKSDTDNKIYYVGRKTALYPFALHLAEIDAFKIPEEEKRIETTYPNYIPWVESSGETNKDWYLK